MLNTTAHMYSNDRFIVRGAAARQFLEPATPSPEIQGELPPVYFDPRIFQQLVERTPQGQSRLLSTDEAAFVVNEALSSYQEGVMAFPLLNEPVLQEIVQTLREQEQRQRDLNLQNATRAQAEVSGLAYLGAVWDKSAAEKRAKEPIVFDVSDMLKMQSSNSIVSLAQLKFAPYVQSPEGGRPKRSAAQVFGADRVLIAAIPVGLQTLGADESDVYMPTNVGTLLFMMPTEELLEEELERVSIFNQESLLCLSTVFRSQYMAAFMQFFLDMQDSQGIQFTDSIHLLPEIYPEEIHSQNTEAVLQRMSATADSITTYDALMDQHGARTILGSQGRDYIQQMYGSVPYALQA